MITEVQGKKITKIIGYDMIAKLSIGIYLPP